MATRSASSSRSSAASGNRMEEATISWSPVAYREGPLQYHPAIYCKCGQKAPRWISWSLKNPGRRYYTCTRRRAGGCDFWDWYDGDDTTDFDLRDKVWRVTNENEKLRKAISEGRAHVEQMQVQKEQLEKMTAQALDWRRLVPEKGAQVAALIGQSKKFEKERVVLRSVNL